MVIDFKNLILNKLCPNSEFEKKVVFFLEKWCSSSKTVDVQTSGSTGTPKIFEIEKERMLHSAAMTCNFLHLQEGDTALLCLPIEYISGKMMVVRSLIKNLRLLITEPSISPLNTLEQHIQFCAMTPLQVENSLDKLHLIQKLIIGGAAVSESLKNKIYTSLGEYQDITIFETYGMSETLSHIALRQIFPKEEAYFTAFSGIKISTDERGCLKIDAPLLNQEILQTNDLVEITDENKFRFLGRVDNVINSGGAKIFPEKLEALAKSKMEHEIVFIGVHDEVLGEKLIAVIESEEQEELKSMVLNLDFEKKFHQPKAIYFIEKLPRTPNGKISRLELKKLFSA